MRKYYLKGLVALIFALAYAGCSGGGGSGPHEDVELLTDEKLDSTWEGFWISDFEGNGELAADIARRSTNLTGTVTFTEFTPQVLNVPPFISAPIFTSTALRATIDFDVIEGVLVAPNGIILDINATLIFCDRMAGSYEVTTGPPDLIGERGSFDLTLSSGRLCAR